MSIMHINESCSEIGISGNRIQVRYKDGTIQALPVEAVDSITILGKSQVTTQCVQECLTKGIPVAFFSKGGKYFGRLQSTGHVNAERQRMQCSLYETDFAIDLAKIS